jgi:uncharacterized repeat protein (TIGR01451 family)
MSISNVASVTLAGAALTAGAWAAPTAARPTPSAAATTTARVPGTTKPSPARLAHPPAGPRLSINVTGGPARARPGDLLPYTVSVRNSGTSRASRLTVTLTLPQGAPLVSASPHGTAAAGKVTWHAGVAAGRVMTFRATARVTHPRPRTLRLAAVACALATGKSSPTVCAADLDRYDAPAVEAAAGGSRTVGGSSSAAVGYAAGGGAALLAAGTLIVVIGRRSRSRRRVRHSG